MKILGPMDFTLVGANAIKYAHDLYPDADITCLYCMTMNSFEKMTPINKQGDTKTSLLEKELANEVIRALGVNELPANVTVKAKNGEAVATIKSYANKMRPDFIMMGTRDKYDMLDKWLGTVSLGVIKSCDFPTCLIPRHASYHGFKKVLVAADNHMLNTSLVSWLKQWNHAFKAFIKFLHIQQSEKRKIESISEGLVTNLFEEDNAEFAFEIENVKSTDFSSTLLSKAYNLGADLIIAAPDKQSFLQSMLFKSASKELILKSKIPVLFLKFYNKN